MTSSASFPGRGEEMARKRKREMVTLHVDETSLTYMIDECRKRRKEHTLQPEERTAFYNLLDDEHIQLFLAKDICLRISDKYLLAMVLVYFKRAGLHTEEYRENFFASLFLANQFEEDEDFRDEIYAWALGSDWEVKTEELHHQRDQLLRRMDFRAWVARTTCDLIMAQDPFHWAWMRNRQIHHSWAIRASRRNKEEFYTRGPWKSALSCARCRNIILHPCMWKVEGNIISRIDTAVDPETPIEVPD
ncbi:speedy protein 1-B-like [Rhinoderma darwinii]|uniref:speedy protein 1-B-like n=1 Tax=Rhinoderma darwinii TaxID=43563 RepID=UPI003F679C12